MIRTWSIYRILKYSSIIHQTFRECFPNLSRMLPHCFPNIGVMRTLTSNEDVEGRHHLLTWKPFQLSSQGFPAVSPIFFPTLRS